MGHKREAEASEPPDGDSGVTPGIPVGTAGLMGFILRTGRTAGGAGLSHPRGAVEEELGGGLDGAMRGSSGDLQKIFPGVCVRAWARLPVRRFPVNLPLPHPPEDFLCWSNPELNPEKPLHTHTHTHTHILFLKDLN